VRTPSAPHSRRASIGNALSSDMSSHRNAPQPQRHLRRLPHHHDRPPLGVLQPEIARPAWRRRRTYGGGMNGVYWAPAIAVTGVIYPDRLTRWPN
jgi:hypothetical protein